MPIWGWIIIGIIVSYALLTLFIYYTQERFIFQAEILPQDFKYRYEYPVEEVFFTPEEGVRINALHFKIPNTKGVIFYFKGNSRSIKGWGKFARDFISKGYDFFMIDYRGFGKSRGKRSEQAIYSDCQVAYDYLKRKYDEKDILIYGRSMGSGFATYTASNNDPKMLILDSPYLNFLHLMQKKVPIIPLKKLLKYQIPTDEYIQDVSCPVYVIHGKKDKLIPFSSGRKLSELAKDGELFPIEKGKHNDLPSFARYHEVLFEILNKAKTKFKRHLKAS